VANTRYIAAYRTRAAINHDGDQAEVLAR